MDDSHSNKAAAHGGNYSDSDESFVLSRGNQSDGGDIDQDDESSEDDSIFEYDVDDSTRGFDDEMLVDIEQNDPYITSISIGWAADDDSYDWERVGNAIGNSTMVEKLTVFYLNAAFCRGIARNRNIKSFQINECAFSDEEDQFDILSEFFQYNENLRYFGVTGCGTLMFGCGLSPQSIFSLISAVSKFNQHSLREVDFSCNKLTDQQAAELIGALGKSLNLVVLHLVSNKIAMNGCVELGKLLRNPTCKLKKINLGHNDIDDQCVPVLKTALKNNKTVKNISLGEGDISHSVKRANRKEANPITAEGWASFSSLLMDRINLLERLSLSGTEIDDESTVTLTNVLAKTVVLKSLDLSSCKSIMEVGWRSIVNMLQNLNSRLEELVFNCSNFDDAVAVAMASALANKIDLKNLHMGDNKFVTSAGWQSFFSVFPNSESSLETFNLNSNRIDDDGLSLLVNALANANTIKKLYLSGTESISDAGLHAVTNLLRQPKSRLGALYLDSSTDDVLVDFANALTNNTSLKTLHFFPSESSSSQWSAFSDTLCNKSSINATFNSNHTLQILFGSSIPHDIYHNLALNKHYGKEEAARQKILEHHFSHEHENDNIHVFSDIEWKAMPHAISWIGRDEDEFSLMYQLLRGTPSLFESKASTKGIGKKRKHRHIE